jgi:hypothetical protein
MGKIVLAIADLPFVIITLQVRYLIWALGSAQLVVIPHGHNVRDLHSIDKPARDVSNW